MASALAKFVTATLGPRQRREIAILYLRDAGGIDLLKGLCGTIKETRSEVVRSLVYYTGTKRTLKGDFDFVAVEVGGGEPDIDHLWRAVQFQEADGFIWVVDSAGTDWLVESREEMGFARKGGRLSGGLDQAGVSPEAPWLVLVDFKEKPLSMAEARRQAAVVVANAEDDLDWTSRGVSITTLKGLQEAIGWLYKKVK